jgi:hypothetical protein
MSHYLCDVPVPSNWHDDDNDDRSAMTNNPFSDEGLDISEQSRTADGRTLSLDRRLFMQLLAFGGSNRTLHQIPQR